MENLLVTSIVFLLTTALAIWLFFVASNRSRTGLVILTAWLLVQTSLSLSGFYRIYNTIPPRALLLILPPLFLILVLFITVPGRRFIDQLNPARLTLLHIVRVPVELVLYSLFLEKQVPQLMTFAGGNFDIFSGLTAPVIYYFGFVKKRLSKELILAWNFICLGLLFSIVYHAIFAAPTPFQKFAFDQPNIVILHFPFAWLPSVIVPLVLFSHLATIRQLQKSIFKNGINDKKFLSGKNG